MVFFSDIDFNSLVSQSFDGCALSLVFWRLELLPKFMMEGVYT